VTAAPSAASLSATADPMPFDAPVTIATLPESFAMSVAPFKSVDRRFDIRLYDADLAKRIQLAFR